MKYKSNAQPETIGVGSSSVVIEAKYINLPAGANLKDTHWIQFMRFHRFDKNGNEVNATRKDAGSPLFKPSGAVTQAYFLDVSLIKGKVKSVFYDEGPDPRRTPTELSIWDNASFERAGSKEVVGYVSSRVDFDAYLTVGKQVI